MLLSVYSKHCYSAATKHLIPNCHGIMFATSNNTLCPIVVVDEQGKRKRAKRVKLVVHLNETHDAAIVQAVVVLHKK